jgi:hypothetical protein
MAHLLVIPTTQLRALDHNIGESPEARSRGWGYTSSRRVLARKNPPVGIQSVDLKGIGLCGPCLYCALILGILISETINRSSP